MKRGDMLSWATAVLAGLVIAWALAQSTGCAAFKPASSAGPSVKLWSLQPARQEATENRLWELRRYEVGVGAQTMPLEAAKGYSCVSAGDMELLLKAVLGI